MKRKQLHQSSHQFDQYPFETFWYDSWRRVECLTIRNGVISTHLIDDGEMIEENISMSNLRVKSRRATLSDCTLFLRPGVDICALTTAEDSESSDEDDNPEPVWIDAQISSIERKPHEDQCACQFYINFYVNQGPLGITKRSLKKEIKVVQIDQIALIQKLEAKPCEDKHYRWSFAEDCTSRLGFKLFTGKFASDLSWFLVASVLKQVTFEVRCVRNRIVYQIMETENDKCPSETETHVKKAINFKLQDGISTPVIVPFGIVDPLMEEVNDQMGEGQALCLYDKIGLRRTRRRCVQPDRYLGCEGISMSDVDTTRFGGYKTYTWEYDEVPLALSIQADHAFNSERTDEVENEDHSSGKNSSKDMPVLQRMIKSRDVKSVGANQREERSQLAIIPLPLPATETDSVVQEDILDPEIPEEESKNFSQIASKYVYITDSPSVYKKKASEANFMEVHKAWSGSFSNNKIRRRGRPHSKFLQRQSIYDVRSFKKNSFSASVYRELIKRCVKNIEATMNKEQPQILDQWNQFQAKKDQNQSDDTEEPSMNHEEEVSELDMLWKEMELALASIYVLDDNEGSQTGVPDEVEKSGRFGGRVCQHDYRQYDEIGVLCQICGHVTTEIKDVLPPLFPSSSYGISRERRNENSEHESKEDESADVFNIPASSDTVLPEGSKTTLSESEDNVWALIPDLKGKLRFHQKKAFEFLWRNIAGSLVPAEMESESNNTGGCVISHSPGAGKTLLIIAFLVSYLKLFPGSRPLVLAPKTTLYTWYKEIIKWKIPIPVYQIHGGQTYKGEVMRQRLRTTPGIPQNQDVMHVLDCLEKMQKWLSRPSILLMGYTSFLTLTREESKFAHRQYMGQVLRTCPGILILDEGHNPRSTKSRLRKALMKVETGMRVLLSGTLFQNNFGEYFNTLTLARPSFVSEVLTELDPKFKRGKKGTKTRFSLENRARKYFIDKIGKKIDSKVGDERVQGLNMLKNLTGGFIDVYEGGSYDKLPGLQCYTLMMKSTTLQRSILEKLQNQRPVYKGFPLELELLITLGAIHPWLIRTTACARQYFNNEELKSLEKQKFDLKLGSKVRFVMGLIPRCLLRKEKVLIFCHNIAPINLFLEIFERFYGWQKGEEVLVLQGDLELFERGRVMDKFEEPGGPSKVMLASITACAEGISLTAASRVILLDSEWNPSKSKQAIARAFRPGQDKVVYVYQLLATGTLEEEKHSRTTWKEWVSSMIFSEELVEDPSHWQAEKIEDELLREIVEEDRVTLFHMIMKNEKASNMRKLQMD